LINDRSRAITNKQKSPLILTVLLLLCFTSGWAHSRIPPQVKFKPILANELEKLAYVNAIAQDKDGFIWIGAIQGLARYDGYTLKTYTYDENDPTSISHNWIKQLTLDSEDNLWAVSQFGVCRYQALIDKFDCIEKTGEGVNSKVRAAIFSMLEDTQGNFWVSTSEGLKILDPASRTFNPVPQHLHEILSPSASSEANVVHQMVQHPSGDLWFGLQGNGVVRYTPSTQAIKHFRSQDKEPNSLPANKIRELLIDSRGDLWVGSLGGGIARFNSNTNEFIRFKHSNNEKADTVWDIIEDESGIFWIADGTGVHLYDPETSAFREYNYVEGAQDGPGNFVGRDLFIDNAKGIWVGYFPSGVDTVDLQASEFLNYRHNPGDSTSLPDGGVLATLEQADGDIWVGCGFGLGRLDRETGAFKRYVHDQNDPTSLSGSTPLDMDIGPDGSLWVGSWDRGLNHKAPNSDVFKRYAYDPAKAETLYGREPWAVRFDKYGNLWVGTEKGVNLYRPDTDDFERVMPTDQAGTPLQSLYVRHIYSDSSGIIWVASFNGLYSIDPVTKRYTGHYSHNPDDPESLSSNQILSILEDRKGFLWVGTGGNGLNKLDLSTGKSQRFGVRDGLPNPTITGLIADRAGNMWVSTYKGLSRYNPHTGEFQTYDKHDGTVGNLYNRNSPSLLSTGELVFGGSRGLTIFDPEQLSNNTNIPPVVITELSIFNKPVPMGPKSPLTQSIAKTESLKLSYTQSVFSFEFAALSYRSPGENQYAYRLNGFETNWNYVGNRRSATYTNLDPGAYVFEVKASNNSGIWNEKPTRLTIVVSPPWWRSIWAYLAYILAAIALALRVRQTSLEKLATERKNLDHERAIVKRLKEIDVMKDEINRELDSKVAKRTEELRREHERLLSTQNELKMLNTKLADVSVTDQLTGLKNRRFLYQTIEEDAAIVSRQYRNSPDRLNLDDLTFALLDIDHFKEVNDLYGHSTGDKVLVQLSHILQQVLRESDYIVRWGGEEFVIVIRHLPRKHVTTIIERLTNIIKQHEFVINTELTLKQTCSIGIASYPFIAKEPARVDWEQIIKIADRALYSAKSSGRDCWVWLEPGPRQLTVDAQIEAIEKDNIARSLSEGELSVTSSVNTDELAW